MKKIYIGDLILGNVSAEELGKEITAIRESEEPPEEEDDGNIED